jgi:hypothetical protein
MIHNVSNIRGIAGELAMQTRAMGGPAAWKHVVAGLKARGISGKTLILARDLAWELRRQLIVADKAKAAA